MQWSDQRRRRKRDPDVEGMRIFADTLPTSSQCQACPRTADSRGVYSQQRTNSGLRRCVDPSEDCPRWRTLLGSDWTGWRASKLSVAPHRYRDGELASSGCGLQGDQKNDGNRMHHVCRTVVSWPGPALDQRVRPFVPPPSFPDRLTHPPRPGRRPVTAILTVREWSFDRS